MPEPTSSAVAGGLLAKLLPAGIGAAIMVCVDPPQCKRELFARVFVALACAYLFGDTVLDLLHSFSLFAFLDAGKRAHQVAIDGLTGGLGWSFMGGVSMWMRKFRANPIEAIDEAKKVV